MVKCGLSVGCKNPWLPGGIHSSCSERKVIPYNLCVQAALKTSDKPDVRLCGTIYCNTNRPEKGGVAAGRAAAAASGGSSAGPAKQSCPICGHGAREDTLALHELYRRWAGESGAYIITFQSARVARLSLREAAPKKQ